MYRIFISCQHERYIRVAAPGCLRSTRLCYTHLPYRVQPINAKAVQRRIYVCVFLYSRVSKLSSVPAWSVVEGRQVSGGTARLAPDRVYCIAARKFTRCGPWFVSHPDEVFRLGVPAVRRGTMHEPRQPCVATTTIMLGELRVCKYKLRLEETRARTKKSADTPNDP